MISRQADHSRLVAYLRRGLIVFFAIGAVEARSNAGPVNDNFANRITLAGSMIQVSATNDGATVEPGEPQHAPGAVRGSLWWSWTSANATPVTVATINSDDLRLVVAIYRGSSVNALVPVARGTNLLFFDADPGVDYQIAVDGYDGFRGEFVLDLAASQVRISSPNSGALLPTATNIHLRAVTVDGEAPVTQVSFFDQTGILGTVRSRPFEFGWTNPPLGNYTLQAQALNTRGIPTWSRRVDVRVTPFNDSRANALVITGAQATITGNNTLATFVSGEDPRWGDNQGGHSLWYKWTSPIDQTVEIGGSGEGFLLLLNVVTPGVPGGFAYFAANALSAPHGTGLRFGVRAGRTYYISVDGFLGEQGSFTFYLRSIPANDDFATPVVLEEGNLSIAGSTKYAGREVGEPHHAGRSAGASVWWLWTAPATALTTVSISGASEWTTLAIYAGTNLSFLSLVSDNAEDHNSTEFVAERGITYRIVVDNDPSDRRDFTLEMEQHSARLTSPGREAVFESPANVPLAAMASPRYGRVRQIELRAGTNLIGTVTSNAPTFIWTNVDPGIYEITARAVYFSGIPQTSAPVRIRVEGPNTEPPHSTIAAGPLSSSSYLLNSVGEVFVAGAMQGALPRKVVAPDGVWQDVMNDFGLTRTGRLYRNLLTSTPVPPDETGWASAATGVFSNSVVHLGLTSTGRLYYNMNVAVPFPRGVTTWLNMAAGSERAIALGDDHQIYTWGPEIALSPATAVPRKARLPSGVLHWKAMASGLVHSLAIGDNNQLYAWGRSQYGQLGDTVDREHPTIVPKPSGIVGWRSVAAGAHHSLAIADDGKLYAWGRHSEHQLGVGYVTAQIPIRPTSVLMPSGVTEWIAVAAGTSHSLAVGNDCRLYGWGANNEGQLGLGPAAIAPIFPDPDPRLIPGFPRACAPLSVVIREPAHGRVIHLPGDLAITAVPSLTHGAVSKVEFFADAAKLGETFTVPSTLIWSNGTSGYYWLTARTTDSFGNVTVSGAVNVRLNSTPQITLASSHSTLVAGASLTLSASAIDPDGQIATVQFLQGEISLVEFAQPPFTLSLTNMPTGTFAFTARVFDDLGGSAVSIPVSVQVIPNHPPDFVRGPDQTVAEDAGDQEIQNWATAIVPGPPHESGQNVAFHLITDRPELFSVQPTITPAGTLRYTSSPDANGVASVSVALWDDGGTASGGRDHSPMQSFRIVILPVNDRPTVRSATVTVAEDTTASFILQAIDVDGDPLTYFHTTTTYGTLAGIAPSLTYIPNANYYGTDHFSFSVTDGQAESEPGIIEIAVLPQNDPPTAIPTVRSSSMIFSNEQQFVVIAYDNTQALVILDASLSMDVEQDPLDYFWFEDGALFPFMEGVTVTNSFEVGAYAIVLAVSDGNDLGTQAFALKIIQPSEAVEHIIGLVEDSFLSRRAKRPLIATLKAATAAFERGSIEPALNQLRAFQKKVGAQVRLTDPVLAETLANAAGMIIQATSQN